MFAPGQMSVGDLRSVVDDHLTAPISKACQVGLDLSQKRSGWALRRQVHRLTETRRGLDQLAIRTESLALADELQHPLVAQPVFIAP